MTHKTYCLAGHTVAITGPDPDALVDRIKEILEAPVEETPVPGETTVVSVFDEALAAHHG